jgi:2-amino-4-hydroxy-6-hydroxymethyldihydropteridine diphosphokinase
LTSRQSESILLSLGSNIEPHRHLRAAAKLLAEQIQVLAASRVFETLPVGDPEGPLFLNAALEVDCRLSPAELKYRVLRPLEKTLGRQRTDDRNAPRTLDVDISLFGQQLIHDEEAGLEIPDPEILTRAHVAIPLADVAPETRHPVVGTTLAEIASRLGSGGVRVVEELHLDAKSGSLRP